MSPRMNYRWSAQCAGVTEATYGGETAQEAAERLFAACPEATAANCVDSWGRRVGGLLPQVRITRDAHGQAWLADRPSPEPLV